MEVFLQERLSSSEREARSINKAVLLSDVKSWKLSLSWIIGKPGPLESELEKVHLNSIAEINDENLKKLFQALAGEDQKHIERLSELLERQK